MKEPRYTNVFLCGNTQSEFMNNARLGILSVEYLVESVEALNEVDVEVELRRMRLEEACVGHIERTEAIMRVLNER